MNGDVAASVSAVLQSLQGLDVSVFEPVVQQVLLDDTMATPEEKSANLLAFLQDATDSDEQQLREAVTTIVQLWTEAQSSRNSGQSGAALFVSGRKQSSKKKGRGKQNVTHTDAKTAASSDAKELKKEKEKEELKKEKTPNRSWLTASGDDHSTKKGGKNVVLIDEEDRLQNVMELAAAAGAATQPVGKQILRPRSVQYGAKWRRLACSLPGGVRGHFAITPKEGSAFVMVWGGSGHILGAPHVISVVDEKVRVEKVKGKTPKIRDGACFVPFEESTRALYFGGQGMHPSPCSMSILNLVGEASWGMLHEKLDLPDCSPGNTVNKSEVKLLKELTRGEANVMPLMAARLGRGQAGVVPARWYDIFRTTDVYEGCGCQSGDECVKGPRHYGDIPVSNMPPVLHSCSVVSALGDAYMFFGSQNKGISSSVSRIRTDGFRIRSYCYARVDVCSAGGHHQLNSYQAKTPVMTFEWVRFVEPDTDGMKKIGQAATGEKNPPARYMHASCLITGNRVLTYGGRSTVGIPLSDFCLFSLLTQDWIPCPRILGRVPCISGHQMVLINQCVVIFGGFLYGGVSPSNRLFTLNIENPDEWRFSELVIAGDIPARYSFTFTPVLQGRSICVTGGMGIGGQLLDDIYLLENCDRLVASESDLPGVLKRLLDNAEMTDFTFMTMDGTELHAHRVILAARSEFLKAMFQENPEQTNLAITNADISAVAMRELLKFLYTDEVTIDLDSATHVLKAAEYFHQTQLAQLCRSLLTEHEHRVGGGRFDDDDQVTPSTYIRDFEQSVLNNRAFSDVRILIGGAEFFAHRCILINRCAYFKTMLQGSFMEAQQGVIRLDEEDCSVEVMLMILRFIYCDHCDVPDELLFPVYCTAMLFMLTGLQSACSAGLQRHLDEDNVIPIYITACDFGDESLRSATFRYMAYCLDRVRLVEDFQALSQEQLEQIMQYRTKVLGLDAFSLSAANDANPLAHSVEGTRLDPNALCEDCGLPYVYLKKTWPAERALPKTLLQNYLQRVGKPAPTFRQFVREERFSVRMEIRMSLKVGDKMEEFSTGRRTFVSAKDAHNQVCLHALHYLHENGIALEK